MYPAEIVLPMKAELTDHGFEDLQTPAEVDEAINKEGTTLVMINSVCGCSAGSARPGVLMAVANANKKPENITKTIEKTKASYSILYDEGLKIMKSYDVAYPVDSMTIAKYKTYGIDFNAVNGDVNGANLPVPAIYVINKKGKIVYRHFDPDYRKRATIKEIVSHL